MPVKVRIGIASGDVCIGMTDVRPESQRVVFGPAAAVSTRLANKAPPGGTVVSEEAREACGASFDFQVLPSLVLKGLAEVHPAYLAVGPRLDLDPERAEVRLPARAEVKLRTGRASGAGRVENVSAGGMYVASDLAPTIGELIEVEFPPIPDALEAAPVVVRGEVRHTRPAADGSAGFGMSIERADSEKAGAMRQFVALYFGVTGATPSRIRATSGETLRVELEETSGRLIREE